MVQIINKMQLCDRASQHLQQLCDRASQHRSIFCSHGGCQQWAASPHLHLQLSGVPVARGAAGAVAVLLPLKSLSLLRYFHLHFTFTIICLNTVKLCIIPSRPPILYLATTHYCTLYVYAGDDMTYFYITEHRRQ